MVSFDDLATALRNALDQDEDGQITSNDILLRIFDMNDDGIIDDRDRILMKLKQQLKRLGKEVDNESIKRIIHLYSDDLVKLLGQIA